MAKKLAVGARKSKMAGKRSRSKRELTAKKQVKSSYGDKDDRTSATEKR